MFFVALAAAVAVPALVSAAAPAASLFQPQPGTSGFATLLPTAAIGEARIHVAQNRDNADALVRIQDLEEQIRVLTGQVEGLQFQLTQMQTLLERMTEDNEFRFQALEGGAGGKPQAAAPTDGATPSDVLPQDPAPIAATEEPALAEPAPLDPGAPMDSIDPGKSLDPLLGGGTDQLGTLPGDEVPTLDGNRPLDLSLGGDGPISSGDANAQYAAGYDAIVRGDYAFAEDQFQQFVALYPEDPQAADAVNWLGEALIQRAAYTDAAQVLADGYTKYKDSKRAPDIMLKLGVALAGAEQPDVACRTFFTLAKRYPELSTAFRQRLTEENQKAQCPVIQ